MASNREGMKIVLQVGAELRIRNNGDVTMDNPELELAQDDSAADAVLLYRFNKDTREHVLRLVEPVADHKHVKVHLANARDRTGLKRHTFAAGRQLRS